MKKILSKINKLSVLLYVAGIIWFCLLMDPSFNDRCYFSENALLPGLTESHFSRQGRLIKAYNKHVYENNNGHSRQENILDILKENDIEAYEQSFSHQSKLLDFNIDQYTNGTNVYGVVRARRASSVESILINVPLPDVKFKNYAVGMALALVKQMHSQVFWAKDVIILFTEHGIDGANAWMNSYNGLNSDNEHLQARAGSIQAGIVLENLEQSANYINLKVEGFNGQLPNLDFFNLVVRLAGKNGAFVSVNHNFPPSEHDDLAESWKQHFSAAFAMMTNQAVGRSTGNHAVFLRHKIETLTIESVHTGGRRNVFDLERGGRIVESVCRSLNNLMERFHQSFFFYLLPSTYRYISIGVYMRPLGLILLAPLLQILCIHFVSSSNDDGVDEADDETEGNNLKSKKDESAQGDAVSASAPPTDLCTEGATVTATEPPLPKLEHFNVSEWIGMWSDVARQISFCFLAGAFHYYLPELASCVAARSPLGDDDDLKLCLLLLSAFTHVASVFVGMNMMKSFTSEESFKRTYECSAILFVISLGVIAVVNFSFGFLLSACVVPSILMVGATRKSSNITMKHMAAGIVLLVAPVSLCGAISAYSGDAFSVKSLAKTIFEVYQYDQMYGIWTYTFSTLIYFPLWLQLTIVALTNCSSSRDAPSFPIER